MPIITAIKPQKNQKRVNVYLDGKFGFGIDLENFVKLGLKVEQELSDKKIGEIIKKAELQKTLAKLLKFATLRPRSGKEIKNWFKRKKVHESLHRELFNRLKHFDLVDDRKFAAWWIEQRKTFKPMGIYRIKAELRLKGIDKTIIDDLTQGNLSLDEQKKFAKEILKKKIDQWRSLPPEKIYKKAFSFLAGRGFDYNTIESVIDGLVLKRYT